MNCAKCGLPILYGVASYGGPHCLCHAKPNYGHNALADLLKERDQLRAENERLSNCLRKANGFSEKFERNWYLVSDERDTLRTQLAEIESALVAKNHEAHDLEIDNRQLRTQLAEARELLERCLGWGPLDWDLACKWCNERDNWLEANKA